MGSQGSPAMSDPLQGLNFSLSVLTHLLVGGRVCVCGSDWPDLDQISTVQTHVSQEVGVSWPMKFQLEDVGIAPKKSLWLLPVYSFTKPFIHSRLLADLLLSCLVPPHCLSSHSLLHPYLNIILFSRIFLIFKNFCNSHEENVSFSAMIMVNFICIAKSTHKTMTLGWYSLFSCFSFFSEVFEVKFM